MKNYILIIILFSLSIQIYSQNLTFEELMSIKGKGIVEVEEYLTSKNWEYNGVSKNKVSFAYGEDENYAEILGVYFESKIINSFVVMFYSKEKYKSYLNKIKSLGCILVSSDIKDDIINKLYSNGKLDFHIDITKKGGKNQTSLYAIFIIKHLK